MAKKLGPCKDCVDRHEACWSDCERYKAYRAELDEENKRKREAMEEKYITYGIRQSARNSNSLRLYSLQGKARNRDNGN